MRIAVNPGWTSLVHLAFMLCLVSLFFLHHPVVFAQTENPLTLDMVDGRLSGLRDAGTAEDSSIVSNYAEARSLLVQAEVFERERQQSVDALRNAPLQESEVRSRIEQLEASPPAAEDLGSLDRDELRARLLTESNDQEERAGELASLDRRLAARENNAAVIRERLAAIRLANEALPEERQVTGAGGAPSESEAIAWKAAAERIALRAERQALEARLSSQPIRYSLMAIQRNEIQLIVARLSDSVRALEDELAERTLELSDASAMGFDPAHAIYPIAQALVDTDRALREERLATSRQLTETRAAIEGLKTRSNELKERFSIARRMVDFAADSDSLGKVLLTHWQELESLQDEQPEVDIPKRTAQTVIRRIELEEILKQMGSSSAYLNVLLFESAIDPGEVDTADYSALREIIRTHRERLGETIDTQSLYVETLTELADRSSELDRLAKEYAVYLKERILWIPKFLPLWQSDFASVPKEIEAIIHDLSAVEIRPGIAAALCLLAAALLLSRRGQLLALQAALNRKISRPRDDSIRHTLLALLCCLLLALPVPLLIAGLASAMTGESTLGDRIAAAVLGLLLIIFVRRICAPEGVGVVHFHWRATTMQRLYQDTAWLMYYWLPVLIVVGWIMLMAPTASDGVILRVVMVAVLLPSVVLLIVKVVREAHGSAEHWFADSLQKFRVFAAAGLAFVVIASLLGHVYSVGVIFTCLLNSLVVGLALLLLYAVLIRWIQITRRRIRMAELLAAQSGPDASEDALMEKQVATLGDVSDDSRELVNASIAAAAIASLLYIWSPLLPALTKLSDITLWTTSTLVEGEPVESAISLATILVILALAALTIYAARKLPAVIDLLLRSQTEVSSSTRYTVSSLLNYSILGVGTVAAFSAMGLQWSQLQWLVAALGVGIGFGLQEIIANFISGLIILFERPIRVGDVVSTGDNDGVVARIRIRATTIVDWDGRELLVPNREFITGRVLNWSLTDPKIRLALPVGIAYGSDVEKALKILQEIVSNHPRVLEDPEPSIIFDGFGDNALSLVARCFLDSMENRLGVMTELNREIYRRFAEADIVIAFPQRDIHFDPNKPLRIAIEGDNPESS